MLNAWILIIGHFISARMTQVYKMKLSMTKEVRKINFGLSLKAWTFTVLKRRIVLDGDHAPSPDGYPIP